jgi:hypothetical protein
MYHINIKIETYTQDKLLPSAEMIVNHSAPSLTQHIVSEIYGLESEVDESLDFDTADRANYTEENSAKTDFVANKVQLKTVPLILSSDIYAWYHMNEGTGAVVSDSSGNARTLDAISPVWVPGKLNGTLQFADYEYVMAADAPPGYLIGNFHSTDPFSLEAWFKTTNALSEDIISKAASWGGSGGYILGLYPGGVPRFTLRYNDLGPDCYSVTGGYNDGNWHHIIGTYDGSNTNAGLKLYVDNVEISCVKEGDPLTGDIYDYRNDMLFSIGSRTTLGWFFDGLIDEAVVYNRVLTPSEVTFRYNAGTGTELMGGFDTSKGWYVRTNTNQINTSTWLGILQIDPIETLSSGTQIRYLISVDNKVTWKKFNGVTWDTVALADIDTQGNTAAEMIAFCKEDYDLLFVAGTLDIVASLKSTLPASTPLLDIIDIHYNDGLTCKLGDSSIDVCRVSPTQHKIKNILTEPLYDVSITMMIP